MVEIKGLKLTGEEVEIEGLRLTDEDDLEFDLEKFSKYTYIYFIHKEKDIYERYQLHDLARVLGDNKIFLDGVLFDRKHNILTVYTDINNPYLRIVEEEPAEGEEDIVEYQTSIKNIPDNIKDFEKEIEYRDTLIKLLKDYVGFEQYNVIKQIADNQHPEHTRIEEGW